MDEQPTKVIFRKETDGTITAVFPELPGTNDPQTFTVYAHIGQHSSANYDWYRTTTAASLHECESLFRELQSIGYNLQVVKRFTARHSIERRKVLMEMS